MPIISIIFFLLLMGMVVLAFLMLCFVYEVLSEPLSAKQDEASLPPYKNESWKTLKQPEVLPSWRGKLIWMN